MCGVEAQILAVVSYHCLGLRPLPLSYSLGLDAKIFSVVTVSKCFLSVGFGRFCRKNLRFWFGLGFRDKCVVNFFMTRVIWHDFHHH